MLEQLLQFSLILIDEGFCRYHIRKDNVLVIYELLSKQPGKGRELVERIKIIAANNHCKGILAKCPIQYASNTFWTHMGFENIGLMNTGKTILNVYYYDLSLCA